VEPTWIALAEGHSTTPRGRVFTSCWSGRSIDEANALSNLRRQSIRSSTGHALQTHLLITKDARLQLVRFV
jgi:hypothetical protein